MDVLTEIGIERERQIYEEGWTREHDDEHDDNSLGLAASCYAYSGNTETLGGYNPPSDWPWEQSSWKPEDYRRNLVKAGALIVAEIERLDRVR